MEPVTGRELWFSDGTKGGTRLITDLEPGEGSSEPKDITPIGHGQFLFTAAVGSRGRALYVTDGTAQGTALLVDAQDPSSSESYLNLTRVADRGFFLVRSEDRPVAGDASAETVNADLWVTDGTPGGTRLVRQLPAAGNIRSTLAFGDRFVVQITSPRSVVWVSDGTPEGTTAASLPISGTPVATSEFFWFVGPNRSLKRADASLGSIIDVDARVNAEGLDTEPNALSTLDDLVFYKPKQHWALFVTKDGKPGTTKMLTEKFKMYRLGTPKAVKGKAFFFASPPAIKIQRDGRQEAAYPADDLYVTNGTPEGTKLVRSGRKPNQGGFVSPYFRGSTENGVFFQADLKATSEFYYTDGTPKKFQRVIALPKASGTGDFYGPEQQGAQKSYFTYSDGKSDAQLYISDGTPQGTISLTTSNATATDDSMPVFVRLPNGCLVGTANTGVGGRRLFVSDGTLAGTRAVDTAPGKDSGLLIDVFNDPRIGEKHFVVVGDNAFFLVRNPASGLSLWKSDGTAPGTRQCAVVAPADKSPPITQLPLYGGSRSVYIDYTKDDHTRRLLRYDTFANKLSIEWDEPAPAKPSAAQEHRRFEPDRGPGPMMSSLSNGVVWGDRLVIDRRNGPEAFLLLLAAAEPSTKPIVLHDGIRRGAMVIPFADRELSERAGKCYYLAAGDDGMALWETDGTVENTRSVSSFRSERFADPEAVTTDREVYVRTGALNPGGLDLRYASADMVRYDLDTRQLSRFGALPRSDRSVGPEFVQASHFFNDGELTYFIATGSDNLRGLYATRGTPQDTCRLWSLGPISAAALTEECIVRVRGTVLVATPSGEVLTTDGTPQGTRIDEKLTAQFRGMSPKLRSLDAAHAYVVARTPRFGAEPWLINESYRPLAVPVPSEPAGATTAPSTAPTSRSVTRPATRPN